MSSLFELSAKYQQLMDEISRTDELTEEMLQAIETTNDGLEEKVLNYTSIVKELESKASAIDQAIANMLDRSQKILNSAERLKNTIKREMEACDKKHVENPYHVIKVILNNPRVDYNDKSLLPETFMRHKVKETVEPDAIAILKALKDGIAVPGAFMIRETRLQIR